MLRSNIAAGMLSAMSHWHSGVDVSYTIAAPAECLDSSAVGVAQLVAYEAGESILCMRRG